MRTLKDIKDSEGFTSYNYTLESKKEGTIKLVYINLDLLEHAIRKHGKNGDEVLITSSDKPSWKGKLIILEDIRDILCDKDALFLVNFCRIIHKDYYFTLSKTKPITLHKFLFTDEFMSLIKDIPTDEMKLILDRVNKKVKNTVTIFS